MFELLTRSQGSWNADHGTQQLVSSLQYQHAEIAAAHDLSMLTIICPQVTAFSTEIPQVSGGWQAPKPAAPQSCTQGHGTSACQQCDPATVESNPPSCCAYPPHAARIAHMFCVWHGGATAGPCLYRPPGRVCSWGVLAGRAALRFELTVGDRRGERLGCLLHARRIWRRM